MNVASRETITSGKGHLLEREGCSVHYWLIGPENAPLVLLIHGAGTDHHMFDPQLAVLARSFRLLLCDLRGHGMSQPSNLPFTVDRATADMVGLLDHLGCTQCVVVGVSLGGTIAQQIALGFPERVAGLVVLGAPCNTLPPGPFARLMLWTFMLFVHYAPTAILHGFLAHFAAVSKNAQRYVCHAFSQVEEADLRQIMEAFNDFWHQPLPHARAYRRPPTLLMQGERDWNRHLMPRWARSEPECQYVVLWHAGHLANWDESPLFNAVLEGFLHRVQLQVVRACKEA